MATLTPQERGITGWQRKDIKVGGEMSLMVRYIIKMNTPCRTAFMDSYLKRPSLSEFQKDIFTSLAEGIANNPIPSQMIEHLISYAIDHVRKEED